MPFGDSSHAVPGEAPGLGPGISRQACAAACAPFTPNDSEQRSRLTCYRGCWHVISRRLFSAYRRPRGTSSPHSSSAAKALYNLPAFLAHAASLRRGFPHCGIFLPAASRRSLGRVSVPMCPSALSGRIPVVASVGRYPAAKLMGREPLPQRGMRPFPPHTLQCGAHPVSPLISVGCPCLGGTSSTCYSPVRRSRAPESALPLDLHG